MKFEWDEAKNLINLKKHGLAFDAVHDFDWDYALALEHQTLEHELRQVWIGPIDYFLHSLVMVERGEAIRIISLRRATKHEKAMWRDEFQK